METKNSKEKIKIMIADDFPLLLEDMCELIERQEDMEVVGTAGSGKKIVELALSVGVTKREIKVSFSLFPQSNSNNVCFLIRNLYCVLLKGVGESGQI